MTIVSLTESFEELNDFGLTLDELEQVQIEQNNIRKEFREKYPTQVLRQKEKEYNEKYQEGIKKLIHHYEKLYMEERKKDVPFTERKYILDKIKTGKELLNKTFSLPINLQMQHIAITKGLDYYFSYYPIYESVTKTTQPARMVR